MNDQHDNPYPGNGASAYFRRLREQVAAEGVPPGEGFRRRLSQLHEAAGLAEPFKGITTNGVVRPGLFSWRPTGVSTEPLRRAALTFLETLTPDQRRRVSYAVDDDKWRRWMNTQFYFRDGLGFLEMDERQRAAALNLMAAGLSAQGLQLSRDIMRLNHTLGELNDDNFVDYGEWQYWITILGQPNRNEPWGWQLDGHHLNINYFILGDQVVMTPLFVGTEPAAATTGTFAGTTVLQAEQNQGLALLQALDEGQRRQAVLHSAKTDNYTLTEAFNDNRVLDYAGIAATALDGGQRARLFALIKRYVDSLADGHARIWLDEVANYLDETHFAWIGGAADDAVFYYRIQSPVILIEFDHQRPFATGHLFGADLPHRQHIHAVVRTPNGNDYGKDLLRQHHEQHPH